MIKHLLKTPWYYPDISNNKSSGNQDDRANCKILEICWVLTENTPRWRQSWLRQLYSGEGEVDKIAERLVDPE